MANMKASLAALLGKSAPDKASDTGSEAAEDEEDTDMESEDASEDEAEADAESDQAEADDEAADGEDGDGEDGDEGGDEMAAQAGNIEAAFSLLNSQEAKGRDELAKRLAKSVATGKMSSADAKDLLKASPRKSSLSEAMAGRDKAPGTDAPAGDSALSEADNRLLATAAKMKEARARK